MNLPEFNYPNIVQAVGGARKLLKAAVDLRGDEKFAIEAVHNIARFSLGHYSDQDLALEVLAKTTIYAAKLEQLILDIKDEEITRVG